MMANRFQIAKAEHTPDWSIGQTDFDPVWGNAFDLLRFHRGKGFTIQDKPDAPGPVFNLSTIKPHLEPQLMNKPLDTVLRVRSQKDNYTILFRKHEVFDEKGPLILAHARALIGTPYMFAVTDCSWLTMSCYGKEGITLPHNAHQQHLDPQVLSITRSQIKPGDLLFHRNDEHVSLYLDGMFGGRVIDTEPHNATAPWGGTFGVGVRIRSMQENYYCDWQHVDGIGRLVAINGKPA